MIEVIWYNVKKHSAGYVLYIRNVSQGLMCVRKDKTDKKRGLSQEEEVIEVMGLCLKKHCKG